MTIALRGSAVTPTGNPTTSFSVTIPASVVANDLCFLTVTSRDNTNPVTGPLCTDTDVGGNTWAVLAQTANGVATVFWKRATSGTASKSVTVSNCVGSASGVLKCFSGCGRGATPYSNATTETNASGDESHAGFTPSQGDSMLCAAIFNYGNDENVTSLSYATAGATTATEKTSTGGNDCGNIFGHVLQTGEAAGTGTLTWAQTDNTTYSIVWAIKPNAFTMSATSGSYSAAGTAAGLKAARKFVPDGGVYSLTGTAAGLKVGRKITADGGAYALSGTAVAFVRAIKMTVDSGVYSVSGAVARLAAARKLAVDAGSYSITGTSAGLKTGRTVTADAGNYAIAGTAAGLRAARQLAVDSGSIVLTGNAVGLKLGHRLPVDGGVYSLLGSDVSLNTVRTLPAQFGSYAILGTDVGLFAGRNIVAEDGQYSLDGSDVELHRTASLTAEEGMYVYAGDDAQLRRDARIEAEVGVYALVGQSANLIYTPSGGGSSWKQRHRWWWVYLDEPEWRK